MNKAIIFLIVVLLAIGFSFLIPGVREAVINLTVYGRLSIGDAGPTVERIFIEDETGNWVECPLIPDFANCWRRITAEGTETIDIKAEISDINADCDDLAGGYYVQFYVCMNQTGSTVCNLVNADPDIPAPGYIDGGSPTLVGTLCNWTATYNFFDYWKKWGVWYINATAKDPQNATTHSITRKFFSTRNHDYLYPYPLGSNIDLGIVNLGAWTNATGQNTTRNIGNVRFNISWSANNFTGPAPPTPIEIDDPAGAYNERFCIDNDTVHNTTAYCGFLDAIPLTSIWWFPSAGVRRCGDDACSSDEDGAPNQANFDLWYHIYVESGKTPGDYNNTIIELTNWCDPDALPCGSGF